MLRRVEVESCEQDFKAKVFEIAGFQSIELPPECQFEGDEVWIRRDEITGGVILSEIPHDHANPSEAAEEDPGRDELG